MEINYDYLLTGTAIGFRACRELCSNYLLFTICSESKIFSMTRIRIFCLWSNF